MNNGRKEYLSELYSHIADELNISETMMKKAISSYSAVGNWLGECEPGLDVKIMPQGSFNLGTVIKPVSDKDDYDIDLVCLLKNGSYLMAAEIKNIVGDRLKQHETYGEMLADEGKRCWTLQYDEFHMDVLPAVPRNKVFIEPTETEIRLTHKMEDNNYEDKYSNPYQYRIWFENSMRTVLDTEKRAFAIRNKVEISEVSTNKVKTPLQKAIQLLKRHRDIMFEKHDSDDAPISIIITTLATKAYSNETDLYDALCNIVKKMPQHIVTDDEGKYHIDNPVMTDENFADKWNGNLKKVECFNKWMQSVTDDIINNPLTMFGTVEISKLMKKNFGENISNKAYNAVADKNRVARESNSLYVDGLKGGITLNQEKNEQNIPEHTFYGK